MSEQSELYKKYSKLIEVCKARENILAMSGDLHELEEEIGKEKLNEMLDIIMDVAIQIHMKHIEPEDLDVIIAFHQSPLGQKLIDLQPKIANDIKSQASGRIEALLEEHFKEK